MATPNRASLITKTQKVLKKNFEAVHPPADRPLLEHWLYACVLENAPFDKADEAFARLQEVYFELNEVRVTTATELAETFSCLPDPLKAGKRVRAVLQAVFEKDYTYDLEPLKKLNIGKAVKTLEDFQTNDSVPVAVASPFSVAYVTQQALGGHSIPADAASLRMLNIIGVITDKEEAKGQTPGLERAIPKTKGIEFASQLHQLSIEFAASPQSTRLRNLISSINAEAKERFPKRKSGKAEEPAKSKTKKSATKKSVKKAVAKKSASKRITRKKPR